MFKNSKLLITLIALGAPSGAVAGLPSDFSRSLTQAIMLDLLGYVPYVLALGVILWSLWKGKWRRAALVFGAVAAIGVLFPWVAQSRYLSQVDAVQSSHIVPDRLDLSGRNVLVVSWGAGCYDLCEAIARHNDPASLQFMSLSFDAKREFGETGSLPFDSVGLRNVPLDDTRNYPLFTQSTISPEEIDYIVLKDFQAHFGPALSRHFPEQIDPNDVGLALYMGPVNDARRLDFSTLQPDVLFLNYRPKTLSLPLHFRKRFWVTTPPYRLRDRALGRLLCPEPGRRLRGPCREIR